MKKLLWIIFFAGFITQSAKADQLSYLTQAQAELACELIQGMEELYLFCGCCNETIGELVQVNDVHFQHTGYEDFYQVILTYTNSKQESVSKGIDLAYTWATVDDKIETLGELLDLDHDPCRRLGVGFWD